ncbi:MAG: hypothetical protein CMP10_07555 [Zetaproteobacteria bacterium]|nr:hypothetical protein [Pseudobdellovibrionaceae bacterium]
MIILSNLFKRRSIENIILYICIAILLASGFAIPETSFAEKNERFQDVEIRVIRPRFFNKRKRLELGFHTNAIMNESFIYTLLVSGSLGFHITEQLSLETSGGIGTILDKEDKRILFDDFEIRTKIFRTSYFFYGALQYTPIYGKWQLSSGKLIYFDTFISGGVGQTGIKWKFSDFCTVPSAENANPIPEDYTGSYPSFILSAGQRYFFNKETSVRFEFKFHSLTYNTIDSSCDPENESITFDERHNSLTLSLGITKFL